MSDPKLGILLQGAQAPSGPSYLKKVKDTLSGIKPKQYFDVALFGVGIFLVYNYGKSLADAVESQIPDEKEMLKMINESSGQPGHMM